MDLEQSWMQNVLVVQSRTRHTGTTDALETSIAQTKRQWALVSEADLINGVTERCEVYFVHTT